MFSHQIDADLLLRPFEEKDAPVMFGLIEADRGHLDPWLRWSGRVKTEADTLALIRRFLEKYEAADGFHAGLWLKGELAGGLVCHFINRESSKTEIGYWLGARFVGQGLATRACRAVIDDLFTNEGLHRIEIQCATDNLPSRAVAERLGFRLEGIKRESEWLTTRFADHCLYALLAQDWQG